MNRTPHTHDHHDGDGSHEHDLGLQYDLSRFNRRRALSLLGAVGAGAVGFGTLSACGSDDTATTTTTSAGSSGSSSSSTTAAGATTTAAGSTSTSSDCDVIPEETAGPYPGDGSNGVDVLSQSGVVRSDIRSSFGDSSGTAEGIPATLKLKIEDTNGSCGPLAGAAVYVWHCDREGRYSMYSSGAEDQNYLRGVQKADADGNVEFTTIFPACYSGRWPHIHFEIYESTEAATSGGRRYATSQLALPKATCDAAFATSGYEQSVTNFKGMSLSTDNVFSDDGAAHQIATVTGDPTSGYVINLTVPVDSTATSSGSSGSMSGGPGGPPPGA